MDHATSIRRSRAVIVSPNPDSDAGGTERFCNLLAGVLESRGHRCEMVGPPPGPSRNVIRVGLEYLWKARAVQRLAPAADLVVTTGFLGWPQGWHAPRVHVYVGTMGAIAWQRPGIHWRDRLRTFVGGGLADAIGGRRARAVAISERVALEARRFYGVRPAVIHLGVDTELFAPRRREEARQRIGLPAGRRFALFVGRGEPGKNPGVAQEACRTAGYELLVAGAQPVPGGRALGVLRREELAWAYSAADVVVFPSSYEGFGYVTLEALACCVPVVTSPTGWAPELVRAVPQYAPLVVRPEAATVARALERLGSDDIAVATEAARAHILRHNTLEVFSRRWNEFLDGMEPGQAAG